MQSDFVLSTTGVVNLINASILQILGGTTNVRATAGNSSFQIGLHTVRLRYTAVQATGTDGDGLTVNRNRKLLNIILTVRYGYKYGRITGLRYVYIPILAFYVS